MHKQRMGILIAAAAGMLGAFLPWVTFLMVSVSGINSSTGWLILVLFGAALAMTLIGNKQSILTGAKFYVAIAAGAVAALIAILNIVNFKSEVGQQGGIGSVVSIGVGLYVIILAGIAVVVLGFILKKE